MVITRVTSHRCTQPTQPHPTPSNIGMDNIQLLCIHALNELIALMNNGKINFIFWERVGWFWIYKPSRTKYRISSLVACRLVGAQGSLRGGWRSLILWTLNLTLWTLQWQYVCYDTFAFLMERCIIWIITDHQQRKEQRTDNMIEMPGMKLVDKLFIMPMLINSTVVHIVREHWHQCCMMFTL